MNDIMVSACIITYNHEKFLRECLEAAVNQQVNFDYEIVIGDDCSIDSTSLICKEYAHKYPKLVKYFPRKKNLGMISNWANTIQDCKGKYIALCEGDDYWTDPLKLKKQVDFLEDNNDYVLCFHKVNILKTNGVIVDDFITRVPDNYETIETLARLGNYIHTPSVVFRNIVKKIPFEFLEAPFGDFFLYMLLAEHGKLKYIEENMAVYRHGVGVISEMNGLTIANNNVKLYSCMVSYLKNETVKKIIFERQIQVVTEHYENLRSEYDKYFIFKIFIFDIVNVIDKFFAKIKINVIKNIYVIYNYLFKK